MAVLSLLLFEKQSESQKRLWLFMSGSEVWAEWSSLERPELRACGLMGPGSGGNESGLGACCHSSLESSLQVEYGTI